MPPTLDPATRVITIPQSDLTLISGTLYELDTDAFRKDVNDLLSSEPYIWMPVAYDHNQEYTVTGVTYARKVEFINNYSITFEDLVYSVRLAGSNNNIFDVDGGILNTNNVTVIGQNSAGLQVVVQGSGVTSQDITDIGTEVWSRDLGNTGLSSSELMQAVAAAVASELAGAVAGQASTITIDRVNEAVTIISADVDSSGNRTSVTITAPGD